MKKIVLSIAAILILASAGLLYYASQSHHAAPTAPKAPPPTSAVAPPAAPSPPPIQNPVPAQPAHAQTLPSLDRSDSLMHSDLDHLIGARAVRELLRPRFLIRHIVVTIDNLPRRRAAVQLRPFRDVPGKFLAKGTDQSSTLDPANYQRYEPYVRVLEKVDARQLVDVYFRLYPLFQQAYQQLGYPNGYFNDRLLQVIDNLLAAPQARNPIMLVRPKVMYRYADAKLEDLSAGQKMMVRMGPKNEAAVKAKLRRIRTLIMANPPQSAPAPGPASQTSPPATRAPAGAAPPPGSAR